MSDRATSPDASPRPDVRRERAERALTVGVAARSRAAARGVSGTAVLALTVALLALSACFEDGPFETSSEPTPTGATDTGATDTGATDTGATDGGASDTATATDAATRVDAEDTHASLDAVDDTVSTAVGDTTTPRDTAPGEVTDAAADGDTTQGPPCLSPSDCAGVAPPDDLCRGTVACVDYRCVVDPDTVVTCEDPGEPCLESACDPETGACVTTQVCQCEPVGALPCDTPATWTAGEAGATDLMAAYACPIDADGPERTWSFQVEASQRVRVDTDASRAVAIVPYDASDCAPDACVAGGEGVALFDAIGGQAYAVVVEEGAAGEELTLTAECDVTAETRCDDGLDDDGDGLTDCDDTDCDEIEPCIRPPDTEHGLCFDDVDNDDDGDTDCQDEDCWGEAGCLQTCRPTTVQASCGFGQGLGTGGGDADATDYTCGPSAGGKEVVYRFAPDASGTVTATMSSGAPLALYLMDDRGAGCTPLHCLAYGPNTITWSAVAGTTYYLSIDGPEGVTGQYFLDVECDL